MENIDLKKRRIKIPILNDRMLENNKKRIVGFYWWFRTFSSLYDFIYVVAPDGSIISTDNFCTLGISPVFVI